MIARVPAGLTDAGALLDALAEALSFPGWFGRNWDALSDCLGDLSWIPERDVVLDHVDMPALADDDLRVYLDVLDEAVASWGAGEAHTLRVVFAGRERPSRV